MIRDTLITPEQAADIRRRYDAFEAWRGNRASYHPDEIPARVRPFVTTNEERGKLEQFEIFADPPASLFCYVWIGEGYSPEVRAKVWTGDLLGYGSAGREYRGNFGDKRRPVAVIIAGFHYSGTAFVGAGDYARLKRGKRARPAWEVRYNRPNRAYYVQTAGRVSYVVTSPDAPDFGKVAYLPPGYMATYRQPTAVKSAKVAKREAEEAAEEHNARKRPDGSPVFKRED